MTAEEIAAIAAEHHAEFPQYAGHWDGPEWYLVRFTERVNTKMGDAFLPGDVTIARDSRPGEQDAYPTAYSLRNKIDTAVYPSSFERL